jgi:alkylation response protein AidB-like acyl-CoA dehydrogenase
MEKTITHRGITKRYLNMHTTVHPSSYIDPVTVAQLRSYSSKAEQLKTLHTEQLAVIYDHNWFNLFVPKKYNGLELNLPDALKLEEAIAWIDGALGWTVTLCSGAAWFVGFLETGVAANIFNDEKVCFAGSGRPSGTATIVNGGYKITGKWNYATGAPHATIFTANCIIEEDGKTLLNEEGNPLIKSFFFLRNEVSVIYNWNTLGMIATASEGFEVNEITVDKNRSFNINSSTPVIDQPLYRFPFLQFAETTLAINFCGMAQHFIDLCGPIFNNKNNNERYASSTVTMLQQKSADANDLLQTQRAMFYEAAENAWNAFNKHHSLTNELLQKVSTTSRTMAITCRQIVDDLYPYCGLAAADTSTEINRVWRDFHTATQHSLLNYAE